MGFNPFGYYMIGPCISSSLQLPNTTHQSIDNSINFNNNDSEAKESV